MALHAITTGLGHRIYRGDAMFGFWEREAERLEAGDVILEVVPVAMSDAPPLP